MDSQVSARPYAEAAYAHAAAAGADAPAEWKRLLEGLAGLTGTVPLRQLMADPRFTPEQRSAAFTALLSQVAGDSSAFGQFSNFCLQLLANGRLEAAPEIAEQYASLHREAAGIVEAEIRTAFPLDDEQIGALTAALKRRLGCSEVRASVIVDESLGGGVRIRFGDDAIDATVTAELERMRSALLRTA